jgi:hypothetical protein
MRFAAASVNDVLMPWFPPTCKYPTFSVDVTVALPLHVVDPTVALDVAVKVVQLSDGQLTSRPSMCQMR